MHNVAKVVHFDIKPENILANTDDVMKIADFGISKMMEKGEKFSKIGGTRMFLPPETWQNKEFEGEPVDIWALGITFFYLAFEYYPFQSADPLLFNKIVEETEVKYPENSNPMFISLLKKMIEKNPNKRATLYEVFDDPWITEGEEEPMEKLKGTEILEVNEEETKNAFTVRKIEINMFAFSKMKTKLFRARSRNRDDSIIPNNNN